MAHNDKEEDVSKTLVRPGSTSEDRFQRLQQRSIRFQARRLKGGRGDQNRKAIRDSRES